MSDISLENELNNLNHSLADSRFFSQLGQMAGGSRWEAGLAVYTAPAGEKMALKEQQKLFRETRSQMARFFKQEQKSLNSGSGVIITGVPGQLTRLLDLTCRASGMNRKVATGEEVFSVAALLRGQESSASGAGDAGGGEAPGVAGMLRVFSLFGPLDLFHHFICVIAVADGRIRKLTPLDFREAGFGPRNHYGPHFMTLEDLKNAEILHRSMLALDSPVKDALDMAFGFWRQICESRDPFIRLTLLTAAIEFIAGLPENEPLTYVSTVCAGLSEKIEFKPSTPALFRELFALRKSLLAESANAKKILSTLGRGGSGSAITAEAEFFYGELLKKMISDHSFWKKVLPSVKSEAKKDIRKMQNKRRWRGVAGKYLERLMRVD